MKNYIFILLTIVIISSGYAITISNVTITSNSVSFDISGTMTGYSTPVQNYGFSIEYVGSFFLGTGSNAPNSWSSSVFSDRTISSVGNTGTWNGNNYTWSHYTSSLANATATSQRITVSTSQNFFNPNGTGTISFYWGHPHSTHAVLATFNVSQLGEQTSQPTLSVNNTNFGNVRVGTSQTASVTVTNVGDSGSSLTGNIGASSNSDFSPTSGSQSFSLAQNETSSRVFTYTPTERGSDSTNITVSSNEDGSSTATLTGTGVSPVFNSSVEPGSTIDFGMIHLNSSVEDHPEIPPTKYETITISNITTDADLNDLTDLTILDAYISGDTPFEIIGFTPTVLGKGASLEITIRYSTIMAHNGGIAPSLGLKNAVLTLVTDQNAAFGESGDIFTFNLTGEVVPELNSATLLIFALFSLFPFTKILKI